jgi:hypothetical protein
MASRRCDPGRQIGWALVAALLTAMVFAGCGSSGTKEHKGNSPLPDPAAAKLMATQPHAAEVKRLVERYAQSTRDKDYQTLCDELLSAELVRQIRSTGFPCEVALRTGLEDVQNPSLTVQSVEVNDDRALARVRSTASSQATSIETIRLIREVGGWRVASITDSEEPTS